MKIYMDRSVGEDLLDTNKWDQDWKRWIHDMEFRYKYLVEIILRQREEIQLLEIQREKYKGAIETVLEDLDKGCKDEEGHLRFLAGVIQWNL